MFNKLKKLYFCVAALLLGVVIVFNCIHIELLDSGREHPPVSMKKNDNDKNKKLTYTLIKIIRKDNLE